MIARPEDTLPLPPQGDIPKGPCDTGGSVAIGLLLKCQGSTINRVVSDPQRGLDYARAFGALRGDLEQYAEQILDSDQRAALAKRRRRERKRTLAIHEVFGGSFLGWYARYHFAPRVTSGALRLTDSVRALVPDVVARIIRFLIARHEAGSCETHAERRQRIADAELDLPRAHRLLDALVRAVKPHQGDRAWPVGAHWTIGRIREDAIWLEWGDDDSVGPIALPAATVKLCSEDWRILGTVCTCAEAHFTAVSGVIPFGAD